MKECQKKERSQDETGHENKDCHSFGIECRRRCQISLETSKPLSVVYTHELLDLYVRS
jgi:hypothetical protein